MTTLRIILIVFWSVLLIIWSIFSIINIIKERSLIEAKDYATLWFSLMASVIVVGSILIIIGG